MGAVFGHRIGLSTEQVSLFLIAAILGGATLQWPIGRLSDKFDRRRLLTVAAFASTVLAVVAMFAASFSLPVLIIAAFLFAGTSMPLYSLCVAHTNDFLKPEQMVAASGTLILLYGIGAIGGPFTNGVLMEWLGPRAYWGYLAVGFLFLALLRPLPDDPASLAAAGGADQGRGRAGECRAGGGEPAAGLAGNGRAEGLERKQGLDIRSLFRHSRESGNPGRAASCRACGPGFPLSRG